MVVKYHFSFECDWRSAPLAFWVHIPAETKLDRKLFEPPAPQAVPHKGFLFLHVEFETYDLLFSAPAQLDHFIDVLSRKPLPTSRQLSWQRVENAGPNGHWLSRLPASLKSPRKRQKLVEVMRAVRDNIVSTGADWRVDLKSVELRIIHKLVL